MEWSRVGERTGGKGWRGRVKMRGEPRGGEG